MNRDKELELVLEKNLKLWQFWTNKDINANTEYTIIFRFYAVKMSKIKKLKEQLKRYNISYELKKEKRFLVLTEFIVDAIIHKNWSLKTLNKETKTMFDLSNELKIIYLGCERKTTV